MCYPAKIHGLILSDVIGDDLGSISSGMTTFDETNFSDVLSILKKYKLWQKIPIKVKNFISKGLNDINLETPKKNNKVFKETTNTLIGSNRMCLKNINSYSPKYKMLLKMMMLAKGPILTYCDLIHYEGLETIIKYLESKMSTSEFLCLVKSCLTEPTKILFSKSTFKFK